VSYRKYQEQHKQVLQTAPTETKLPTTRPVANYYRQSTDEQVGNISTTIQMVNMPAYLERLGWRKDDIVMLK
jgi:hypothetical protein